MRSVSFILLLSLACSCLSVSKKQISDLSSADLPDLATADPGTFDPGTEDEGTPDPGMPDTVPVDPGESDPGFVDFGEPDPGPSDAPPETAADPGQDIAPDPGPSDFLAFKVAEFAFPETWAFSAAAVTADLQVKNSSTAASGLLNVAIDDPDNFRILEDNCSDKPVPAMSACSLKVEFRPRSKADFEATLSAWAEPGGLTTAHLTGRGANDLSMVIDSGIPWPGIIPAGTQAEGQFFLDNKADLETGPLKFEVEPADDGIVANPNTCVGTLSSYGSCHPHITVTDKAAAGKHEGVLRVSANPGGGVEVHYSVVVQ